MSLPELTATRDDLDTKIVNTINTMSNEAIACAPFYAAIVAALRDALAVINTRISRASAAPTWRPISDPPPDREEVLLRTEDDRVVVGYRYNDGYISTTSAPLKAWAPIPAFDLPSGVRT